MGEFVNAHVPARFRNYTPPGTSGGHLVHFSNTKTEKQMNEVRAEVSQYSRESGRLTPDRQLQKLESEWSQLEIEKKQIDAKLAGLKAEKRERLAQVYRTAKDKSESCARTNEIEADYQRGRSEVIKDKLAIEERMNQIRSVRSKLHNQKSFAGQRKNDDVLLRIEKVLNQILAEISK